MRAVARFIHSSAMQNLLTVLLLIDVLLTLALLEVETEYPACSDALHVCKSANQCHGDPHNIARAKVALRVASQCILALFAAEMIVLIAVTGLRFFREPLYVFDFVVRARSQCGHWWRLTHWPVPAARRLLPLPWRSSSPWKDGITFPPCWYSRARGVLFHCCIRWTLCGTCAFKSAPLMTTRSQCDVRCKRLNHNYIP